MDIKQAEELKRNQVYDPVARWLHIQEMITWARLIFRPTKGATGRDYERLKN